MRAFLLSPHDKISRILSSSCPFPTTSLTLLPSPLTLHIRPRELRADDVARPTLADDVAKVRLELES